ncbi:unnamed protein product [Pylaiella littoralis]
MTPVLLISQLQQFDLPAAGGLLAQVTHRVSGNWRESRSITAAGIAAAASREAYTGVPRFGLATVKA